MLPPFGTVQNQCFLFVKALQGQLRMVPTRFVCTRCVKIIASFQLSQLHLTVAAAAAAAAACACGEGRPLGQRFFDRCQE